MATAGRVNQSLLPASVRQGPCCFFASQSIPPDTKAPAMSNPMAGWPSTGQRGYHTSNSGLLPPDIPAWATPAPSHARRNRTKKKSAISTCVGHQAAVHLGSSQASRSEDVDESDCTTDFYHHWWSYRQKATGIGKQTMDE